MGGPLVQMLGLSAVFMVYGLLAHAAQRASLGINLALSDR